MNSGQLPNEIELESKVDAVERLDIFVTQELSRIYAEYPSRSKITKWIKKGSVRLNDVVVLQASAKVECGDTVNLRIPETGENGVEPRSDIELNICFEDEAVLVLNKQAGVSMHPGAGQDNETTLAHALVGYLGDSLLNIGHPLRPGIVHRLDKDTSGLVVIAKTLRSYQKLSEQFLPPRRVHREYLALTETLPLIPTGQRQAQGTIDMAIGRHPVNRKIMQAVEGAARNAVTHWELAEKFIHGYCLKLRLETGRTHQIRVHLKSLNAPIVGDRIYGYRARAKHPMVKQALQQVERQMLHACRLQFEHPLSGENISFEASLPSDFIAARQVLNGIVP